MIRKMFVLNFITFLAAFLLFQIELIISKILLPQYGGSYFVWGACVVFFQAALFLGYLYAHIVSRTIGIKKYLPIHLGLLAFTLLFFPGRALPQINSLNWNIPLVFSVFLHLCLSIGLVFFVLSTTSVILQMWLADSDLSEKSNPYVLYALSNAGSFAALVSYPFFFELFFGLKEQVFIWRIAYFVLVALNALALFTVKVNSSAKDNKLWSINGISYRQAWQWFFFSAAGAILFLSVTSIITYEIAPAPLLWIIPLCIYLFSFVLNFRQRPWCPGWITDKFYLTLAWSIVIFFLTYRRVFPFTLAAAAYFFLLFSICMFCQRNLYKSRPSESVNLPVFYLVISLGGFIGGVLNTWVMPVISILLLEYLLGLVIVAFAFSLDSNREAIGAKNVRFIVYLCLTLILWPLIFKRYNFFGIVMLFMIFAACFRRLAVKPAALFLGALLIFCITPFIDGPWAQETYIYRLRDYYGVYKVSYANGKIFLAHGSTVHGAQFSDKQRASEPLTYFHRRTPVGEVFDSPDFNFKNAGIVGLGAGTLTAYAKAGQKFDYFEIDPRVSFIANDLFNYISNSSAKVNFIFGDARLNIKEAQSLYYDILVIDAFSGDSIPVHLLTTEAISEYRKHLRKDGVILFHISNRYLDLVPVLFNNANYLNAYSCYKINPYEKGDNFFASQWLAITWDPKVISKLIAKLDWRDAYSGKLNYAVARPWTDDYSNLVLIMRLRDFLNSIRFFRPFNW